MEGDLTIKEEQQSSDSAEDEVQIAVLEAPRIQPHHNFGFQRIDDFNRSASAAHTQSHFTITRIGRDEGNNDIFVYSPMQNIVIR